MMEEKKARHTPGPWEKVPWSDEFQSVRIFAGARIVGFSANSDMTREELEANASLMTLSPEMLEAISDMVSSIRAIDSNNPDLNLKELLLPEIEFCEAVIKKAKGLE